MKMLSNWVGSARQIVSGQSSDKKGENRPNEKLFKETLIVRAVRSIGWKLPIEDSFLEEQNLQ